MYSPLLPLSTWKKIFNPFKNKRIKYVKMIGNVGDDLIIVGTYKLFQHYNITLDDTNYDEIVIAGGGNMGTLYNGCRAIREAQLLENKPITILPQSWFGKEKNPYSTIWARERYSFKCERRAKFAPDLALCVTPEDVGIDILPEPAQELGVHMREDIEKVAHHKEGNDPTYICTTPKEYILLAAKYQKIITNRLHFAIAGLIARRDVTICSNSYYKNKAMWKASLGQLGCKWKK